MLKTIRLFHIILLINLFQLLTPPESHALSVEIRKSKTVYITKTGAKYHRLGCRHLKSCIPIDRELATQSGYHPCKVCNP